MKRCFGICLTLMSVAAVLLAADFWEKKDFKQWNDKEVRRILTDSPWAHEVQVSMPGGFNDSTGGFGGPQGVPGPGGGPGGAGGAGRPGGGGVPGEAPGGGVPDLARPMMSVVIRWESAMPVKQAGVLSASGSEKQINEQHQAFLDREETNYVVSVSGLPAGLVRGSGGADRLKDMTRLERGKGLEALSPEKIESREQMDRVSLYFLFPRTVPITADEKTIDFVLKLDTLVVKRRFKLQEMMYQGKLSL